ncbi:MAG: heparinase II/III-family protein [Deltaproteobacteria bacterium]|nr:heparinase II/III-family protein [Deltaproteobacteria bacterium]
MGERFLRSFEEHEENFPMIGDSDDSHAIAPGLKPKRHIVDTVKNVAFHKSFEGLVSSEEPVGRASQPSSIRSPNDIFDRFGQIHYAVGGAEKVHKPLSWGYGRCLSFFRSGYTLMEAGRNTRIIFDHGPLGMPPLYNHGHADCLSLTLSVDGRQILVDPGTYRYNRVNELRKYFKGTRSHNTVTVDGKDQAVQQGNFIWTNPFTASILERTELSVVPGFFSLRAARIPFWDGIRPATGRKKSVVSCMLDSWTVPIQRYL